MRFLPQQILWRRKNISKFWHSGKLIGGFCALSGVFILTLPIPIVVNSFAQFYKNRLWRNEVSLIKQEDKSENDQMKVEHKKKERIKQIAADRRTAQKFFLIQVLSLSDLFFFFVFFFDWLWGYLTSWDVGILCFVSCPVLHWWCWNSKRRIFLARLFW